MKYVPYIPFLVFIIIVIVAIIWKIIQTWRYVRKDSTENIKINYQIPPIKPIIPTVESAKVTSTPVRAISSTTDDINSIELNEQQRNIYEMIENSTSNYFITGKAGTGKSVLLKYFVKHTKKDVVVLAPTGISAILVGGQTIHSFFGMDIGLQDTSDPKQVFSMSNSKIELLNHIDTIVIDEISMVRSDVMDMIDSKLKYARENNAPFGGCQIIAFGDLFQLPPIVDDVQVYRYLINKYRTIFFFGIPLIRANPFVILELQEVFRQTDKIFIDILNNIRLGNADISLLEDVNTRCVLPENIDEMTTLTGDNATASSINAQRLDKLSTEEHIYNGIIEGQEDGFTYPTDLQLRLKEGALIMMLKNDSIEKPRWVNGTFGIVSKLTNNNVKVKINNAEYTIEKASWEKYQYSYDAATNKIKKEVVSRFVQYPVKIAYAITIHKSQGQTFDRINIDLSKGAFASGQLYVALSRCKNYSSLYLTSPIKISDVIVNPEVLTFMNYSNEKRQSSIAYTIYNMKQRTPEWFDIRKNKVTGSVAYKLRTRSVKTTISETCLQTFYENDAMRRGRELEKIGISLFSKTTGIKVDDVGFIQSNKYSQAGYSPDGVVYDKNGIISTIIEHKAFNEARHFKNAEYLDSAIKYQIQFGMFVSYAKDAYLVLYNPDIENERDQLIIKHIERDDYIQELFKSRFRATPHKTE